MINRKPLVSVIMPIKECNPAFLDKSISSVLAQTYQNFELIVVIDRFAEKVQKNSFDVLEKYSSDDRLKIVYNDRKGFVQALNFGIVSSHGEYIARMDGDDISLPNRLSLQIEILEKQKADFVGGWAFVIDEYEAIVGRLMPPTDYKKIKRLLMLHNPFLHSTVTFRRAILERSGLYNSTLFGAEDYELWMRIISLGYKCVNLPDVVLYLREARGSIVRGKKWRNTRVNYAKAKVLGVTRLGYTDPLSIAFCLFGPFSSVMAPIIALRLKSFIKWFEK